MIIANYTRDGFTSTLLIPEKTAWLPYVCLVVTVMMWLGYDFYRFHRNHLKKYARIEEHAFVVKDTVSRQRISMISGIGLRFRRGKPILGDVWNTSPSSSDMSVYCAPRRNAIVSYSREVTPSDEGGEYSETDLFASSRYGSCEDLVQNEVPNTQYKGWEIGGEFVKGNLGGLTRAEDEKERSHDDFQSKNSEDRLITVPSPETVFRSPPGTTIFTIDSHQFTGGTTTRSAGGGVDDGGGGTRRPTYRDAATQTCNDFMINVTPDQNGANTYPGHVYIYPVKTPYSASVSPRPSRHGEASESGSPHGQSGSPQDHAGPWLGNFSPRLSSEGRSTEAQKSLTLPKYTGGKSEKKYSPSLNLDLPYSPTSEIVASKHGFAVEGLEVPHFPGSGGRSLPSSGSDIFKPSSSRSQGHSLIKPLNPSPAVTARVVNSRSTLPRHSVVHMDDHQPPTRHTHHHRHRRRESVVVKTSENPPSKTVSLSRKPSRHHRDTSSPRAKDSDTAKETVSMKLFKESTFESAESEHIPSHLYHQDEEGFFSSLSSSQAKQMFNRHGDDYGNKGILFFSRLAGIGKQHESGMGGGGRVTYKSGGFES